METSKEMAEFIAASAALDGVKAQYLALLKKKRAAAQAALEAAGFREGSRVLVSFGGTLGEVQGVVIEITQDCAVVSTQKYGELRVSPAHLITPHGGRVSVALLPEDSPNPHHG